MINNSQQSIIHSFSLSLSTCLCLSSVTFISSEMKQGKKGGEKKKMSVCL